MLKNVPKNGLTLREFKKKWDEAYNSMDKIIGWTEHNTVVEITGTEIYADEYRLHSNDKNAKNKTLYFYCNGKLISKVELKNIKNVY